MKVVGSGSRAQDLGGADVIIRLTSSMVQRSNASNDAQHRLSSATHSRPTNSLNLLTEKVQELLRRWTALWQSPGLVLPQDTFESAPQFLRLTGLRRDFCRPVGTFSRVGWSLRSPAIVTCV